MGLTRLQVELDRAFTVARDLFINEPSVTRDEHPGNQNNLILYGPGGVTLCTQLKLQPNESSALVFQGFIKTGRHFERSGSVKFLHYNLDELYLLRARKSRVIEKFRQLGFVGNGVRIRELPRRIIAEELEQRSPMPVRDVVIFPALQSM